MADLLLQLPVTLAGRYTIEREIGRGGMATVYLARDLRVDRKVAVKVFRPDVAAVLGHERFLREIQIASRLSHPNILPLYDSGEAEGFLYYVMPYVQGETLRDRLEREGQLPLDDALQVAREIAQALSYAHSSDVVHRDIKPENILLESGHAVVADFGIARAISAAAGDPVTSAGIVLGTPAYMSPEQASGNQRIDGRSDIYSLGCVLFEMLAGEPPFTGPSAQAISAKHLHEPPPSLRVTRPTLPVEVQAVVETALAKTPADRFTTASRMAEALTITPSRFVEYHRPRRRRHWAAILVVVLGALAVWKWFPPAPKLDRSLYLILPFGHREGASPQLLNGDLCESLLREALGSWQGLNVVDPLWVNDARQRRGGKTQFSLDEGLALARTRGAGVLLSGEVWQLGDTIHVRATTIDAAQGKTVREASILLPADLSEIGRRFRELADSLVVGTANIAESSGAGTGSRSLPALQAYTDGQVALRDWDLDAARRHFELAAELDPEYPQANLWVARVRDWAGDAGDDWRSYAAQAAALGAKMGARDAASAKALTATAEGRYGDACEEYRQLIARDSLDYTAWFGLGDCLSRDTIVVRDSVSPSGWRFRSGYHSAVQAYQHVLRALPSTHLAFRGPAFSRLTYLFFTEPYFWRTGSPLPPDTGMFGAFPSLLNDTLAFVPFPLPEVSKGRSGTLPATQGAAIARNQRVLLDVTTSWVKAFPNSGDAHEALAMALEAMGLLQSRSPSEPSALAEARRARVLSSTPGTRFRRGADEVRLNLKLGEFGEARRLTDSLLRDPPQLAATEAPLMAGLALLTGQVNRAAEIVRGSGLDNYLLTAEGTEVQAPPQVVEAARAFMVYASAGGPLDSLTALDRRVASLVRHYVRAGDFEATYRGALDFPRILAFPELGMGPTHRTKVGGNFLMEMQWSLARGDTATFRAQYEAVRAMQSQVRPNDVAMDAIFMEAWLILQLGDTTAAIDLLDASLNSLPSAQSVLLWQVPQVGALIQAMALRSDLAAAKRDSATAARWAQAVVDLWSSADSDFTPFMSRMKGQARGTPRAQH